MGFAPSLIAFAPGLALAAGLNNIGSHLPHTRNRFRFTLRCARCGESRGFLQSSGLLAYLSKRGHCPHCGARRSARYAVFELLTGALFVGCFLRFGLTGRAFVGAALVAVLIVLAAIDLEHRILPNAIVLPASAAILIADIAVEPSRTLEWIVAAVATSFGMLAVALAYRGSLGMGDVKLGFLLGAGLGWGVVLGLVAGFAAAGFAAILIILRRGFAARKETIPLGPFLAAGAIAALLILK